MLKVRSIDDGICTVHIYVSTIICITVIEITFLDFCIAPADINRSATGKFIYCLTLCEVWKGYCCIETVDEYCTAIELGCAWILKCIVGDYRIGSPYWNGSSITHCSILCEVRVWNYWPVTVDIYSAACTSVVKCGSFSVVMPEEWIVHNGIVT